MTRTRYVRMPKERARRVQSRLRELAGLPKPGVPTDADAARDLASTPGAGWTLEVFAPAHSEAYPAEAAVPDFPETRAWLGPPGKPRTIDSDGLRVDLAQASELPSDWHPED